LIVQSEQDDVLPRWDGWKNTLEVAKNASKVEQLMLKRHKTQDKIIP